MFSDSNSLQPRRPPTQLSGRLIDRVDTLKDRIRDGVVEVVGRTAAETAEVLIRKLFSIAPPPPPRHTWGPGDWHDESDDDWDYDSVESDPGTGGDVPERRSIWEGWPWGTVAVAALHGLVWWLRKHSYGTVRATVVAAASVVLLLLD